MRGAHLSGHAYPSAENGQGRDTERMPESALPFHSLNSLPQICAMQASFILELSQEREERAHKAAGLDRDMLLVLGADNDPNCPEL